MKKDIMKLSLLFCGVMLIATNVGAMDFDWAVIGNTGNAPDGTKGSVDYEYSIAKTEVTNAQYIEFLNAVADTDPNGLYNSSMGSNKYGGIIQSGTSGSYTYCLKDNDLNWAKRPVVFVDWYDTLRFTNWLHNGQPIGIQNASTTEYGAYDLSLIGSERIERLEDVKFFLPNTDEWYKAAYYDPIAEVYYDYATR